MNESINWISIGIGTVLGLIASIIVTSYFQKISNKIKRLTIIYDTETIDTLSYGSFKLSYKNREYDRLSKVTLLIVNTGNKEIRLNDVDELFNIKTPSSVQLLSSENKYYSEGIYPETKHDESNINLTFKYLNPEDYISMDIIYSGIVDNGESFINKNSRLIGGTIISSKHYNYSYRQDFKINRYISYTSILFLAMLVFIAIPKRILDYVDFESSKTMQEIDILGISMLLLVLVISGLVSWFYIFGKKRLVRNHILRTHNSIKRSLLKSIFKDEDVRHYD